MTSPGRRLGAVAVGAVASIVALSALAAGVLPAPDGSPGSSPAPPGDATRATVKATPAGRRSPEPPRTTVADGSAAPTPRIDAEPTRVVVPALDIDLPIVRPRQDETFPLCDVAEFLPAYGLPGLPGVTYLYGHARTGMFLPMLASSREHDGAEMVGMEVRLYTSDLFRRTYRITEVHRKVRSLDVVNDLEGDALVLQTSETSHSSGTKLVVIARPTGQPTPATEASARPVPRPRTCK